MVGKWLKNGVKWINDSPCSIAIVITSIHITNNKGFLIIGKVPCNWFETPKLHLPITIEIELLQIVLLHPLLKELVDDL